jgi:hypothetical protein
MKRYKVWLAIAAVFIAGFGSGAVVTRVMVRHFVQRIVHNPGRVREFVERRLATRLRLDAEQRRQTAQTLAHTEEGIRALRREFAPRFLSILSNTESEISATLTPEQRERLAAFKEENRQLWQPN